MITFRRIQGVFLRYFYFIAKLDQLSDLFFWQTMDIFIWGFTSLWIQRQDTPMPHVALGIMGGLALWWVVWRGNYEIAVNLLQELWARNLVNLFSTPLKLWEWISALLILNVCKVTISLVFSALLIKIFFSLNIFAIGWALLPFAFSLAVTGWFMGFISAAIVVYFGMRLQQLAWMNVFILSPFSAVFYPVSALPDWAQKVAAALPTSYIFEGMREVLNQGAFPTEKLLMSLGLNAIYLTLSLLFFYWMFDKTREKGLARLE